MESVMYKWFTKNLSILILTFCCSTLIGGLSTASASVIDAPHNESNNIQCGDCHTYSLWWKHSPAEAQADYLNIANLLCAKCHDEGKPFPNKLSHSHLTMAEMHKSKNGNWETKCTDCHDPHLQGQLDWTVIEPGTVESSLFLAEGLLGSSSFIYESSSNTSTFGYVDADAQAAWTDPALWANKSTSTPPGITRGLIMVVNDDSGSLTFEVNDAIEATAIIQGTPSGTGTIEVQGKLPTTFTPGSAFSLFYGQLLKQTIHTPNDSDMPVKYFDPGIKYTDNIVGGPADPLTPTPLGLCQVCHYYTRYHNYDRLQPDPNDQNFPDGARIPVIAHNEDGNYRCDSCHGTFEGFKPVDADHSFISSSTTDCSYCHLPDENFVDVHNGHCGHCHDSQIGAPALIGSISAGTGGKWPSTPHVAGLCTDCHDSDGPAPDDINGDFTNHPKAFDSDENPGNGLDGGHIGQLSTTDYCANNCHFHRNKDLVKEVHTGAPDSDPCVKCHELSVVTAGSYSGSTMTAKGTYSGSGRLIDVATAGQGDCANCHTDIATNWKDHPGQASHAGQVDDTGTNLCNRCHQYTLSSPEEIVDIIHYPNGWCVHCHDGLNKGALINAASDNGPGTCVDCHTASFYRHDMDKFQTFNHESYHVVVSETANPNSPYQCMLCHDEGSENPGGADMIFDVHAIAPSPPLYLEVSTCPLCHDEQGYLIGSASGHGIADLNGNPNTCSVCHIEERSNHPQHVGSSTMNGSVLSSPSCVTCHKGETTTVVHNVEHPSDCLKCHTNLRRSEIVTLVKDLPPANQYPDGHGYLECTECHDLIAQSFFSLNSRTRSSGSSDGLGHSHNHDGKVENAPGCDHCHYKSPALYEYHWESGLCVACHWQDGTLKGSASGLGTGKPAVGIENDCRTCHGDFTSGLHSSASGVNYSHPTQIQLPPFSPDVPSCDTSGCHTETDLVLGVHSTNGCATCHADSGTLIGSASGKGGSVPGNGKDGGGDCLTCHTTYFDGHQHGTNEHYVSVGANVSMTLFGFEQSCTICHQGLPSWLGTMSLHNPNQTSNCEMCHLSTRTTDVRSSFSGVQDVILLGSSVNPIYCLDCHDSASGYEHYCGNGETFQNPGEQCDDGPLNSDTEPDACRTNCQLPSCGDGVIDTGETCDDGNTTSGDGCDSLCQDTESPVITLLGSSSETAECAAAYTDPGSLVTDNVSTGLSATVTGTVDIATVGNYSLFYNAQDDAGNNAAEVIRDVAVNDTTLPIITLNGNATIDIQQGGTYTELGASAADSCGVSASVTIAGTVDTNTIGQYSITYDVADDAGNNAATVTRTVNVTSP